MVQFHLEAPYKYMRKDFNKLLCEHERHGSDRSYHEVRHSKKFANDEARRESMKKRHTVLHNRKEFGENLSPLYRFIKKSVGRKWNDVYSELCQTFDMRSVINQHIMFHLEQWVEIEPSRWGHQEFIIDTNGILICNPEWSSWRTRHKAAAQRRYEEELKVRRVIDEFTEYRKRKDGVWFLCKLEYVPEHFKTEQWDYKLKEFKELLLTGRLFDVWDKEFKTWSKWERKKAVVSMKTASKKEIKKHNLRLERGRSPPDCKSDVLD